MSGGILGESNDEYSIKLADIPKTALQAIYHAVTGKTENLSTMLNGNVLIQFTDILRLRGMLLDQSGQYLNEFAPTVTVVVSHANHKTVTYSSWERFTPLQVHNHEVTSAVILKLEFALRLPETPSPQRCVVSINLDSSLPMLVRGRERPSPFEVLGFFYFAREEWNTAQISIDFVDFLVAKAFGTVVEEWFATLTKTPTKQFNDKLLKNSNFLRTALGQLGRAGMAAYLGACVLFSKPHVWSLSQTTCAVAVGLFIWAVIVVLESTFTPLILKRLSLNVVPSIIVLTAGDTNAYKDVQADLNSPAVTILGICSTIFGGMAVNVAASYLYSFLTSGG